MPSDKEVAEERRECAAEPESSMEERREPDAEMVEERREREGEAGSSFGARAEGEAGCRAGEGGAGEVMKSEDAGARTSLPCWGCGLSRPASGASEPSVRLDGR
mmetsp:Transcript_16528/g.39655  ORF Transcript_16528/g.39655 Transcript_16528/m.39655 type:complete len:104 (-) Transcript_16528:5087-5398(-)